MFAELLGLSYIGFCSFLVYKAVVAHSQFDAEPLLDFESVNEQIELENENKKLTDEIEYLKERIKTLEKENIQWYIRSKIV
jgi:cell division protein FtsB